MAGGGTDAEWEGALVVDGEKRPLPVGSTLNGRYGRFYWHVPPGFRGDFELQFTDRATGATQRVTVGVGRPGLTVGGEQWLEGHMDRQGTSEDE